MLAPPDLFIAGIMQRVMMQAAERHRVFIAWLQTEPARLQVFQVMGLAWPAPADEARLLADGA